MSKKSNEFDAKDPLDPSRRVDPNRKSFPVFEIAKDLWCSVQHVLNLIKQGEIRVPQENIDRAKSPAAIQVPREAYVDFLRRRTRSPLKTKRSHRK